MKVLFIILLIFIVIGMPLIILFENFKFEIPVVEPSPPVLMENFTIPQKEIKINLPPAAKESIPEVAYVYKYQYISNEDKMMTLGSIAPELSFKVVCDDGEICPIDTGKIYSLSDFRGKKVILNFWASWCSPCKYEMPILQEFMLKNKDVIVLAIVTEDTKKNAEQYMKANKLTIPIVYDTKVLAGMMGIPRTFFIDETGKVYRVKIGSFMDLNEMEFYYGGTN